LSETVEVGLVARSMQTGRRRANLLGKRSGGEMATKTDVRTEAFMLD
jgi:hypothetical protein